MEYDIQKVGMYKRDMRDCGLMNSTQIFDLMMALAVMEWIFLTVIYAKRPNRDSFEILIMSLVFLIWSLLSCGLLGIWWIGY